MKMKKVLAVIGSSQGSNSCTAQFARLICERAKELCNEPFEYEIITMDMLQLNYCLGCCNCFRDCTCPLDGTDSMAVLKQKLLNSDFFLFGSPVYAHQISGAMKTVIDRLSYWLHLLPLAGKAGIALSTTAATGEMEVLNYLVKMMYPIGIKPVGAYNANVHLQGRFRQEVDLERRVEKAATTAVRYLSEEKKVSSNPATENMFQTMKLMILSNRLAKPGEYDYWKENGYLECETYQELLDKKQK
jgi:multimeric flavodoxin WrbA